MPEAAEVFVKSSGSLSTPTVSGAPAWLNVAAEVFDDDNARLTNSLNAAALPSSAGTYTATVTVSFDGYRSANFTTPHQYTVTLEVSEQRPDPVRFSAPAISDYYETGQTIEIGYSADCERAGDKINIAISIDSGAQVIGLPRLRAGCYLVEVHYAGSARETAVVNLL
jgi:hypothetical protein